jgi:hypothetical protein
LFAPISAAPHLFHPKLLPITEGKGPLSRVVAAPFDQPFYLRLTQAALEYCAVKEPVQDYELFMDGGVTPYNNPSLALLLIDLRRLVSPLIIIV